MEGPAPQQIGSYEVLAKLADGGVGTVYLARRRGPAEFRRLVAIKRLHPQFASDPGFVTMFTDEARLAARIHHANVVSIVELGADDDGYYLVMEYVEGSNLGHFHWHATRGDRKMPRAVALRIVLDALSGLHAAHEIEGDDGTIVNLVHRDVSPQNILLGMDGLARLGDFGIARAEALRAFETRGPALKGKLEYMAPEQIECKSVDRTTDLFAMGIVLWELLTGRRLFPAANQVTTIQRVCFDPIPSPRKIDPTVSLELERICLRALERPRAKRYPTAASFAEELEKAARADAGIATQREVAACMVAVLGSAMPAGRSTARELGRPASGAVPDLAGGVQGKASTYQLPASDPMIKLPVQAHPAVSDESLNTEPYGAVPPLGLVLEPGESAATVHYDERIPLEILAEARLASRRAAGEPDSEPTIVVADRSAPVSAPSSQGAPPQDRVSVSRSSRRAPAPRSGATSAVIAIGVFVAAGLVGLGAWRLSQSRASSRAIASGSLTPSAPSGAKPEPEAASAVAPTVARETEVAADASLAFDDLENAAPPEAAKAVATAKASARANVAGATRTGAAADAAVPAPVEAPAAAQPAPDEL